MKYTSSNKPLICLQTQSTCYKETSKMTIKGVLWHSTGANNPNLKRYVQPSDTKPSADTYSKSKWLELLGKNTNGNDWNHIYNEVGLNAWIGKLANGTVATVQTMPWDYRPWGCGSGSKGSCNDGWIQFEICEDGLSDKNYFNKIYKEACELTAYLCKLYSIDPKGTVTHKGVKVPTIICHQDSCKLGLGSNHGDVYHWFSKYSKDMDTVRADVAALLKSTGSPTTSTTATSTSTTGKTYKIVTPVNKYASAADAAAQKNAKTEKLAAGTYYIYNKYPNGVDGMYNISTDKTGASAGSWINPKENIIKESTANTTNKLYRVRKSKDDTKSQVGAFTDLANAKEACQTAGKGYHVFDWNWKIVYSYKEKTAAVTLSSIAISAKPVKTTYTVGDSFDKTGLVVTATYSDKSTKKVTDYKISGFSSAKAGTVKITVTYKEKTATFKVIIKEKEVAKKETTTTVAVYDLDYPEKTKIVDKSIKRTNTDCVKSIKKILANNSTFDIKIAKAFFKLASKYGIDPMMAISQAILETGWFKFAGSAVTANQHNYCGLGVTSNGVNGASFNTIEDGVTAQLQHLYAYGCKNALPTGDKVLDPRFSLVTRGIATYWQQLAGRWACPGYDSKTYSTPQKAMEAENTYGQKILAIYKSLLSVVVSAKDLEKYFPTETEKPETEKPKTETTKGETQKTETPDASKPETDTEKSQVTEDVIEEEITEEKVNSISTLVFKCIKRIIQLFAESFSKGE